MTELEAALAGVSFLRGLRPDERAHAASLLRLEALGAGATLPASDAPRFVLVVSGRVELESLTLAAGDHHGIVPLLRRARSSPEVRALEPSVLAVLDVAGLDALVARCPVLHLVFARLLAHEVLVARELARELTELRAEGVPLHRLANVAQARRRRSAPDRPSLASAVPAMLSRWANGRVREPAFWLLLGFCGGLVGLRLALFIVFRFGLERWVFFTVAAEPGSNPLHVHHFNYGLLALVASGAAAAVPRARRWLQWLGLAAGAGLAAIVDEWSLAWHLNPDDRSSFSPLIAGLALAILLQVAFFRRFWWALIARAALMVRSRP